MTGSVHSGLTAGPPAGKALEKEYTVPDGVEIELKSRAVRYRETGSFSVPPAETVSRVNGVAEKIGIDSVEQVDPGITDGVPIFRVNNAAHRAKCHRALYLWASPPAPLNRPPRENYGKGMTTHQSRASAMMEAVERYCGQRFAHHRVIRADYREVRDIAVDPAEFRFPAPPPKCTGCPAGARMCFRDLGRLCREWSWGYSLARNEPVLVPAAVVYYPYLSADNLSFMFNDTGGLAAGNTIEEAVVQGMAEIIERDSLYQAFNLEKLESMQSIDLSGAGSPLIQKFIRGALPAENIYAFRIINEKLGPDISTFTAFICYRNGSGRRYFGGSGTSLDPQAGLLRALTEMEQQKVRQKVTGALDPGDLARHGLPRPGKGISLNNLANCSAGDIKSDIELYLERFKEKDMDVIAVNLTHPEIGIPVVRVVIPRLIAYSGSLVKESVLVEMMGGIHWDC